MLKYLEIGGINDTSPFIVQAFSKGLFNIEMGIIDSISIQRGAGGEMITFENIPLDITVTLSIKDLYDVLSITKSVNFSMFANNIGLLDYVGTLCGITCNKPDLLRKLDVFIESKLNKIRQIPGNIKSSIIDSLRDSILNFARH